MFAHEPFADIFLKAVNQSKAVIALGTCATFGGIPAAEGNPTGAISAEEFLNIKSISKPLINIPGCPAHPDWFIGTIIHLLKFGMPSLCGC